MPIDVKLSSLHHIRRNGVCCNLCNACFVKRRYMSGGTGGKAAHSATRAVADGVQDLADMAATGPEMETRWQWDGTYGQLATVPVAPATSTAGLADSARVPVGGTVAAVTKRRRSRRVHASSRRRVRAVRTCFASLCFSLSSASSDANSALSVIAAARRAETPTSSHSPSVPLHVCSPTRREPPFNNASVTFSVFVLAALAQRPCFSFFVCAH